MRRPRKGTKNLNFNKWLKENNITPMQLSKLWNINSSKVYKILKGTERAPEMLLYRATVALIVVSHSKQPEIKVSLEDIK